MFEIFCARKVEDECLNSSLLVFFNGFYTVWKTELKVCMTDLLSYKKSSAAENV